jgi:Transposase DDE domain group 1
MGSTSSLAYPATPCSTGWSMRLPTTFAPAARSTKPCLRGFAETSYRAKSWKTDRRSCARIEATTKGLDIRFVVTSIDTGSAEHIYQTLYCALGQAENLIKLHKAQLASDRTSCRSPLANQMRLILHSPRTG